MKLTDDQKKAIFIGGGIAVIAAAYWMTRGNTIIPTARDVRPAGDFDAAVPGYTTYNVQPIDIPAPGVSNARYVPGAGCGCSTKNDGCFTSSGIDTGRAAVSEAQLIAAFGPAFPEFLTLVEAAQKGFGTAPPTILEMTRDACGGSYVPLFTGDCTTPQTNGF